MDQTRSFLDALWPDGPLQGSLTFWFLPSKSSLHLPPGYKLTDEDLADLHRDNDTGANVYFVLGLLRDGLSKRQRGKRGDIVALPAFALDIDFAHPTAHVAKNLPAGPDDAALILKGAPEPSIVVSTGHGWHVYWRFDVPVVLKTENHRTQMQKAYKAFQAPFIARAAAQGWQLDSKPSLEGVWRLPGFQNCKGAPFVPVEVLHSAPNTTYALDKLAPQAPPRLVAASTMPEVAAAPIDNPAAPQGLLEALKRLGKPEINLVLAGQSFAERGGRDAALQRICSTIAWMSEAQGHSAEMVAEVLRPSLAVWAVEPEATKSLDEEMAKAIEKIGRAQADYIAKKEIERQQFAALREALRVKGAPPAEDVKSAFVQQRTIIMYGHGFFVFDFTKGQYFGPMVNSEVLTFARDAWTGMTEPALSYVNAEGERKQKTFLRVLQEYCTKALKVVGQLGLERSCYDDDESTFFDAKAPMRRLEPEFQPEIEYWLKLLAGDSVEKLLDWIAAVPQLDEQCCALYLSGASNAGKTLLATGLARLWSLGGPAPMERVLSNFNSEMFRCPLVLLDEGGDFSSVALRRLIGSSTHTYSEKNLPRYEVRGAVRVLIAANNEDVLAVGDERMSADDLDAYVKRFLHIHAHHESADWLRANNAGGLMTRRWIEEDLIAKHCLWLAVNRSIVHGQRFIVEGIELDEIHRKLVMHGEASGPIYEWLARFASDPSAAAHVYRAKKAASRVVIGDGKILVSVQGIIDCWDVYMPDIKRPSTTQVGRTLTKVSEGIVKVGPRGGQIRFHSIRLEMIFGWASANQVGSMDDMTANLAAVKNFEVADYV